MKECRIRTVGGTPLTVLNLAASIQQLWADNPNCNVAFEAGGTYYIGHLLDIGIDPPADTEGLIAVVLRGKFLGSVDVEPVTTLGNRIRTISDANGYINLMEDYTYRGHVELYRLTSVRWPQLE